MCGLKLPCQPGRTRFLTLCVLYLASALGFAALQEGVFRVPDFKFSGWMTLLTAATMAVCGHIELALTTDGRRVGTLKQYLKLSCLTLGGMYFTNWSLNYLNYPTRVLFKSSKLLPTMVVGTLMQGRSYGPLEYLASAGLVGGIVLFLLGDADTLPQFAITGVLLITVGLFCDAATSNYEEKVFFRVATPASQAEVIAYASTFGSGWALLLMLPTGELNEAVEHSAKYPQVVPLIVGSATCGYVSVTFVLLLIKISGATVCEMIKSLRKVLTVTLSFVLYPKALSYKYFVGGAFVVISLAATQELQRRKGGGALPPPPLLLHTAHCTLRTAHCTLRARLSCAPGALRRRQARATQPEAQGHAARARAAARRCRRPRGRRREAALRGRDGRGGGRACRHHHVLHQG